MRSCSLADQDRAEWDTALIAEGVEILQDALAQDRLGEFQAQAAIAALHADAPTTAETDWTQILEWYDELMRLHPTPVVELNRAVAVGEADGPLAGLAAVADAFPRASPDTPPSGPTSTSALATALWHRPLYAVAARARGKRRPSVTTSPCRRPGCAPTHRSRDRVGPWSRLIPPRSSPSSRTRSTRCPRSSWRCSTTSSSSSRTNRRRTSRTCSGVYDGVPLTERDSGWGMGNLPDRITLFQGPLTRDVRGRRGPS